MSKRKVRRIKFYDPVWKAHYRVVVGGTKQQAYLGFCKEHHLPVVNDYSEDPADASSFSHTDLRVYMIWIREWMSTKLDYALLAHECVHAALQVLQDRGSKPVTAYDDEHFAYYVQFLFRKIAEEL